MRILPSLIGQALLRLPVIFDEPVAVAIAVGVDPAQRRLGVRPQGAYGGQVAGAHEVLAQQQHEQRCRVDAAVIAAEGDLAQISHLAVAHLVHDLAGLCIAFRLHGRGLRVRKEMQHALRDAGVDPQRHEGGYQGVAAERRAEPRGAGIGVMALGRIRDEHVQVGHRATHDLVEHRVGAVDAGRACTGSAQCVTGGTHLPVERAAVPILNSVGHAVAQEYPACLARLQRQFVDGARGCQRLRRGFEGQARAAFDLVQSHVAEHDAMVGLERGGGRAACGTVFAPHLEQIGKVGRETIGEPHLQRLVAEIAHQEPLVARAFPNELQTLQVQLLSAQRNLAVDEQIGVAQVGAEHRVVVLGHGTQQERPRLFEQQLELRQNAGVAVVQTLGVAGLAADVAALVEHRERVAVLQGPGRPLLQVGARGDGILRSVGGVDRVSRGSRVEQSGCVHARSLVSCRFVNSARRIAPSGAAKLPMQRHSIHTRITPHPDGSPL